MGYIGKGPSQVFRTFSVKDSFTGDGSTTVFTLSRAAYVGSPNDVQVFVDNVRQEPGVGKSYTIGLDGSSNATQLTFSSAPPNTSEIYVIIAAEPTSVLVPAAGTITSEMIADGTVVAADIDDGTVTNAKLTNSSITVSGDSGSDGVSLGETLTVSGTSNEIETAVTSNTLTIGLPNDVTIAGDLTVDTDTLYVDSSNNRVGIGTSSPVSDFEVTTSGLSAGDFVVDTGNKTVNVGRLSSTGGDNGKLFVRDRVNNGLTITGTTSADGTGLFRPDTNVMGISANDSEIVRVTSSGVGIDTGGVAPITELLTIGKKGGSQDDPDALSLGSSYSNTAGSPSRLKVKVYDGGGDNANGLGHSASLMNIVSGLSGHDMAFFTNGGGGSTERMRILSNGNVGIGTSSPDAKLHIMNADAGALISSNTDEFVIENTSATGMTIGSSNTGEGHIYFSDSDDADVGTISYFHSSNYMQFRVNAAERMRIDSSGNVGIGTISATAQLEVVDNTADGITARFTNSNANNDGAYIDLYKDSSSPADNDVAGTIRFRSNDSGGTSHNMGVIQVVTTDVTDATEDGYMSFSTRASGSTSERMRIDSSGRVAIGTSDGFSDSKLHVGGSAVIGDDGSVTTGETGYNNTLFIKGASAAGGDQGKGCAAIQLGDNFSGSSHQYAIVNGFSAYGSLNIVRSTGVNTNPLRTSSGVIDFTIRDNGNVGIGETSPAHTLHVTAAPASGTDLVLFNNSKGSGTPRGFQLLYSALAPDDGNIAFNFEDNSTTRFRVNNDGDVLNHDGTYGTISDQRIKQNITDANSQWEDIKALSFKNFKKKDDVAQYGEENAPTELGLIAQELELTSPNLVKEYPCDEKTSNLHPDFNDWENSTIKGVKYSILYMKAVKALQEAMQKIEDLETENTSIKARLDILEGSN